MEMAAIIMALAFVLFVTWLVRPYRTEDDALTESLSAMLERELSEYGAPEGSDGRNM